MEYMLNHRALKDREAKREDLMTILRGGGDNWKMRFKSKVDDQGKCGSHHGVATPRDSKKTMMICP